MITWNLLQQNNAKNTQPKYNRKNNDQQQLLVSIKENLSLVKCPDHPLAEVFRVSTHSGMVSYRPPAPLGVYLILRQRSATNS